MESNITRQSIADETAHHTEYDSSGKQRETKVRRIRAGYETYQVKKRHSVTAGSDGARVKSEKSNTKSPFGNQKRQDTSKDSPSRNNKNLNSNKNRAYNNHRPQSSNKSNKYDENSSRFQRSRIKENTRTPIAPMPLPQEDNWENELISPNDDKKSTKNIICDKDENFEQKWILDEIASKKLEQRSLKKNNEEIQQKEIIEQNSHALTDAMKKRVQGIAILECPCTYTEVEEKERYNCVHHNAKSNLKMQDQVKKGTELIVNTDEDNNTVLDDKFLVASPVDNREEPISEHSVLDSDIEPDDVFPAENAITKPNSDISNKSFNKENQQMSSEEINALFTKPDQPSNGSSNGSSMKSIDELPYDFRTELIDSLQAEIDRVSSKSSLSRTSSSGESATSRKVSADSDAIRYEIKEKLCSPKRITPNEKKRDSELQRKAATEDQTMNRNIKGQQKLRSNNQMNNILSILNQNRTLDNQGIKKKEIHVERTFSEPKKDKSEKLKREKNTENEEKEKSWERDNALTKISEKKSQSPQRNTTTRKITTEKFAESKPLSRKDNRNESEVVPNSIHPDQRRKSDTTLDLSLQKNPSLKHVHFSADSNVSESTTSPKSSVDKKQKVNKKLQQISDKQYQLKKLLERGFQSLESVHVMLQTSEFIQQTYGDLIVAHQEYAFRYDYESALWKSAFHNIISQFRDFLENKGVPKTALQEIGKLYWNFLQNGVQFLDSLTLQLQESNDFLLEEYLDDPIKMTNCSKQVKFALRSCHLLLIFIGDLERYVAQLQQENNYKKAQECYKQAQVLAPKNGKSYNQLAVVAVMTKHKLDAVYYYTRSLQASNPILTAKDRLTAIFQEIKKKAGVFKKANSSMSEDILSSDLNTRYMSSTQSEYDRKSGNMRNNDHLRDEVWIFLRKSQMFKVMLTDHNEVIDLTQTKNLTKQLKEQQSEQGMKDVPDKLTLRKVNHGFIVHYLYVHCKLYTNIGLEEFTAIHEETLSELTTLLAYPKASSVRRDNLLKYVAINMFMIHYLLEKQGHDNILAGTALDFAIVFAMDMFAVLSKHCCQLLASKADENLIDQFLPAIRIWLRWLVHHYKLVQNSSVSSMLDIWTSCCEFFNHVDSISSDQENLEDRKNGINVYADEDLFLAGFKPLGSNLLHRMFPADKLESGCHLLRLSNTKKLISQLDERSNLPFAYDEHEKRRKPIQASIISSSPVKKAKSLYVEDNEIELSEDVVIEDEEENFGDSSHVDDLKAQKAQLTKLVQENEIKRQAALEILNSHRSEGRHLSENSPTYIVADTNCYIDHLNHLIAILDSKDFTLIVPLIVINELDGLKKGFYYDEKKFQNHQQNVQECARFSVDFLEYRFSERDPNIRAITSSGSEMSTIVFRAEEFSDDRGTNDDVILSCCLRYCKEHIVRIEGDTNVISRDVVLLTNDRNLRVKSHTRFVPTVDIVTFMKMAKFL